MRLESLLLVLASLLLCWASAAGAPQRGREGVCETPKCSWINKLLRRGELRVTGALSGLDDGKVFCNRGVQPLSLEAVTKLWTDIRVAVIITPKDGLIITRGNSSESALSGDDAKTTDWNGTHYLRLSPFGVDCVGLVAVPVEGQGRVEYELSVRVGPAYRGLVLLAVGVGLLVAAPHLSRSVTLFYGAGVTFGVIASILILLYVFSKFVPKKNLLGLGVLAGGYTLFASFFYWFWNHALEVALQHWQYMAAYVMCAGLISFAALYYMGPPSEQRSLNLIQWAIQLGGVACLYLACPLREVGVATVITALLLYNMSYWLWPLLLPLSLAWRLASCLLAPLSCLLAPFSCLLAPLSCLLAPLSCLLAPFRYLFTCLSGLFTPKYERRLLTQQEYEEQGQVETDKAVEELRQYCRHRDNDNIWDKISNLHNSKRFASFLSGRGHVSPQEQEDYECSGLSLNSMSESESDTAEYDEADLPHTSYTSQRSTGSSRSSLAYSMNSSSDSPTFTHSHPHSSHPHSSHPHSSHPHSSHPHSSRSSHTSHSHFTSTPRSTSRYHPPSRY